jgi:hypothetical protein
MGTRIPAMKTGDTDGRKNPIHYFASSLGEWRVETDLDALIRSMKRSKLPFNIYLVRLPKDAPYGIANFAPVLPADQCTWFGFWKE